MLSSVNIILIIPQLYKMQKFKPLMLFIFLTNVLINIGICQSFQCKSIYQGTANSSCVNGFNTSLSTLCNLLRCDISTVPNSKFFTIGIQITTPVYHQKIVQASAIASFSNVFQNQSAYKTFSVQQIKNIDQNTSTFIDLDSLNQNMPRSFLAIRKSFNQNQVYVRFDIINKVFFQNDDSPTLQVKTQIQSCLTCKNGRSLSEKEGIEKLCQCNCLEDETYYDCSVDIKILSLQTAPVFQFQFYGKQSKQYFIQSISQKQRRLKIKNLSGNQFTMLYYYKMFDGISKNEIIGIYNSAIFSNNNITFTADKKQQQITLLSGAVHLKLFAQESPNISALIQLQIVQPPPLPVFVIIIIVVGLVLLIVIVVGIIFCLKCYKQRIVQRRQRIQYLSSNYLSSYQIKFWFPSFTKQEMRPVLARERAADQTIQYRKFQPNFNQGLSIQRIDLEDENPANSSQQERLQRNVSTFINQKTYCVECKTIIKDNELQKITYCKHSYCDQCLITAFKRNQLKQQENKCVRCNKIFLRKDLIYYRRLIFRDLKIKNIRATRKNLIKTIIQSNDPQAPKDQRYEVPYLNVNNQNKAQWQQDQQAYINQFDNENLQYRESQENMRTGTEVNSARQPSASSIRRKRSLKQRNSFF